MSQTFTNQAGTVASKKPSSETGAALSSASPPPRLSREPLLHFALLGSLVFLVQRLTVVSTDDQAMIVLAAQKQRELNAVFAERQQRVPSAAESMQLGERWVEDEALFREALRLDLVHQEPALRDQLVARMRSLLAASIVLPAPSEEELRAFYEGRRKAYAVPHTVSFTEYFVRSGSDADDVARRLVRALQLGESVLQVPTIHARRSEEQLTTFYGPELARKLMALEGGTFSILRSARGLHVVRLDDRVPAHEPDYAALREVLLADFREAHKQRAFQTEVDRIRARFQVRREGDRP